MFSVPTRRNDGYQPKFTEPIGNITVPVGREAMFTCYVHGLGGYRVGWVKADTKAIQAIHDHVITHNARVSVSHADDSTWNLHVKNVQEEDRGQYMCQINTDPMISQMGYLDVVIPPDIIYEDTSGDVMVPEGGNVKLICKAKGYPKPNVLWRREDGREIVIKSTSNTKTKVTTHKGEVLRLTKVSRSEMGAYLCIGTNGVPPSVSKRITVSVHFHPVISSSSQLVGAPKGTEVTLECNVEAFPKSINYWVRESGDMVITSEKYQATSTSKSTFEDQMLLTIKSVEAHDLGSYRCIAKNSLGEVESNIRLYEIRGLDGNRGGNDDEDATNMWDDNRELYTEGHGAAGDAGAGNVAGNDRNHTKHRDASPSSQPPASPSASVRLVPPLYRTLKCL
ncbi:Immunoglobulin subtype,Immunoglobulin-like domain,Immunoglobulin-like fold,Immunoglobulin subtype [Cinara cedri]|uniref:Immunoglobulin subtype,Immunoglobulin-like domain,Immunoglobulin-like fold,Immunoglobulin subtype n=1 Tax=Cinara cedri TaxID=506608 RepID=A0A5E4MTY7_9HEMI|nr:Immunoglobulin subtype,Immunoglobulin-like domain,Immunoglobulin-like fold,Immunoglobulin subtype [Cinara cedri]